MLPLSTLLLAVVACAMPTQRSLVIEKRDSPVFNVTYFSARTDTIPQNGMVQFWVGFSAAVRAGEDPVRCDSRAPVGTDNGITDIPGANCSSEEVGFSFIHGPIGYMLTITDHFSSHAGNMAVHFLAESDFIWTDINSMTIEEFNGTTNFSMKTFEETPAREGTERSWSSW